jgi:hypothetical protein
VNVFALQVLGHFNSTTLDDIRCLTLVVFPDDDFATLVLRSGNHGSPPHTLVIIEIFAGKNLYSTHMHVNLINREFLYTNYFGNRGRKPLLKSVVIPVIVQRVLLKYAIWSEVIIVLPHATDQQLTVGDNGLISPQD